MVTVTVPSRAMLHEGRRLLVGLESRGGRGRALLGVPPQREGTERETRGGGDLQKAAARDAFRHLDALQAVGQRGRQVGADLVGGMGMQVHGVSFQASVRAASLMAMRMRA